MAQEKDLLAKLIDDPSDIDTLLVYADLLQSKGDPRGELIALQHKKKTDEADALLAKHDAELYGPLEAYKTTFDGSDAEAFEWRLGFIRSARLSYDSNSAPKGVSLDKGLEALLTHPSGALLEELVLPINMLDDGAYFGPLLEVIAKHGAPALRRLRVGEFSCCGGPGGSGDYEYEISWSSLGDASALWKAVPRLEKLVIQTGLGSSSADQTEDVIGDIDLPKLKHLEIITGGFGSGPFSSIAKATFPSLETMELWFGSDNYGGDVTFDAIAPLLEGTRLPKLRRLGIMNAEFTDDVCKVLPEAKILPRLRQLSLAYGTMTDQGARDLANARSALGHLERLELHENALSPEGVALVEKLAPEVTTEGQKGAADRYVSLSE